MDEETTNNHHGLELDGSDSDGNYSDSNSSSDSSTLANRPFQQRTDSSSTFNKKSFPTTLIFEHKANPEGERIMKVIMDIVDNIGYNKAFGHKNVKKFVENRVFVLFKGDQVFACYKEPKLSTLCTAVREARKLLNSLVDIPHSSGKSSEGEAYPEHLGTLLKYWKKILKQAEDTHPTPTQSAKNKRKQDSIIGASSPLGKDTNAAPRTSVNKENKIALAIL